MITNIITNNDIVQSHTDNARSEMPMKEGTKSETSAYSIDDNIEKYIRPQAAPTGSTADFIQKLKEAYTSNTPRGDIMNITRLVTGTNTDYSKPEVMNFQSLVQSLNTNAVDMNKIANLLKS